MLPKNTKDNKKDGKIHLAVYSTVGKLDLEKGGKFYTLNNALVNYLNGSEVFYHATKIVKKTASY